MKPSPQNSLKRVAWLGLGLTCVALGAIGAVLPLMPTTVFLLVAAFAFARSSPKLHDWLLAHKIFGKLIRNWEEHGAISKRAKIASLMSMGLVVVTSLVLQVPVWVILIQVAVLAGVSGFILTRPLPPKEDTTPTQSNDAKHH